MDTITYGIHANEQYMNNIVMIPEKNKKLNGFGFYKIIKSSEKYFFAKKMKCETKSVNTNKNKTYEVNISSDFENDLFKRIKKTSVNNKYPIVICSVVQYEV
jgi:hypothetical protein